MSRPAFDTLKYTQSLEESGVDRKQAEAFAKAQKESLKELMEETLATKDDLRIVKEELRSEIRIFKDDLLKWMAIFHGLSISAIGLIMGALKFFH